MEFENHLGSGYQFFLQFDDSVIPRGFDEHLMLDEFHSHISEWVSSFEFGDLIILTL